MPSRSQRTRAADIAANAAISAWRVLRLTLALLLGPGTASDAATPVTGVTTFNALPTVTVLTGASAAAPGGATAADVAGWDFNAISPGSQFANVDVWDGAVGSGNGVAISRNDYSGADFSVIKVSANDLSTFDLESVGLNIQIVQGQGIVSGHSVTLTGLNAAGNPVAGATLTSTVDDALLVTFDVSSNASFDAISAFRVTPVTAGDSIGYLFIDNIHAINFAAVDNVAPNPPSAPVLAPGSDSGTSSSDKLTNVSSPTLTGTAEAGSTVRLYDTNGVTLVGTGIATGGTWSIATSTLSQGNHTITAKATDAAGNVSAASPGLTLTIDTTAATVSSVVLPANGNYGEGENLDFTVNYSKAITVTTSGGTPYLSVALNTGGSVRASFLYGSGTSALTFRYTVANGDYDSNGIGLGSSIILNGGTLRDTAGNNALLTLNGVGSTSGILVDATPPVVSSINRVQATPTNLSTLSYTVTFSKAVTGVDVSDFALATSGSVAALNLSVAPVTTSTYSVTISSITGAGTLRLDLRSSGTGIADLAGNAITSGYTAGQPYAVDRVAPTVVSVGVPSNGIYLGSQNLTFTVNFSETVTVTTSGGTPRLPITLDTGGTVNATYLSGSGTSAITFRYTIVTGNFDSTGVTVSSSLLMNGGAIRDAVGNDAVLALNGVPDTSAVLVDAIVPKVTSVNIPDDGTYVAGDNLDFVATFSEPVVVTTTGGTPYIGITLQTGGTVRANYLSGSGSTTLTFRYSVATGNADSNGISVTSSITTGGGTVKDPSGNNAALGLTGLPSAAGILVDAITPTILAINRQAPSAASTNLSTVAFRVTFSEAVNGVDTLDFTATTTGSVAASIVSIAAVSGSTFDVTVGSITGTGTLRLDLNAANTGITDLAGNAMAGGALGSQAYTIDTASPTITAVAAPASGTYKAGDNLDFRITFSESVTATGAPRLPMVLDTGGTVNAGYISGSGTTTLTFRYTVGAGTLDSDGIAIAPALLLNGGALADAAGNGAVLTLNNVDDTSGVFVDGTAPAVTGVGVPAAATHKLGDALDFTVVFSENVAVTGTPRLAVAVDTGGTIYAPYVSGSGTGALVFRYTVATGNLDNTGVVLGSSIGLNGGTLRDAAGNSASLTLTNIAATSAVLVDGVVPAVVSITRSGGAVSNAGSLEYLVTFSENVSGVAPASFIATTAGTVTGSIAIIEPLSPTSYKVTLTPVVGDGTLRLDFAAAGSGVTDAAGNAPTSGFIAGDVTTLDHTAPAITSVTVPASSSYASGQNLNFTVHLSEAVTVTTSGGTPRLPITLDTGGTVFATYLSGSGTSTLLFRYTIAAGDFDADGITVEDSLVENGGSLRDAASNDLNPALNGVPATDGILIDGEAPTILAVTAPADGTYLKDATLDFTVDFSEPVVVTGSPGLPITLNGGGPGQAAYLSGSGTDTLTFRYVVGAGQRDTDGIAVSAAIALNGGTIRDDPGNNASLVTPGFDTSGVLVDGLVPAIVSIARFAPTRATTSLASVTYRVTFNKAVSGLDAGDFTLTKTGTADGTIGAVTSTDNTVFDVAVDALLPGGTIRLDLAAGSGVQDSAGNSLTAAFASGEIYTLSINQAPSFTAGDDISIGQDEGAQTLASWATDIDPGAPGESSQALTFTTSVDEPSLFTVAPAIAPDGTLTFTPNPNASGTATITAILHDDADANTDSAPATFTITLTSYKGQLGTYNGVVQAAPDTDAGNEKTGLLRVVVGRKGAFTGSLKLGGFAYSVRGSFNSSGVASFGKDPEATTFPLERKDLSTLDLSMQLDVSGGTDTLTATLTDEGADFAAAVADRALYVAAKNPAAPLMNVPAELLGRYTVVFAAKTPEEQGLDAAEYPQGDGVGVLVVGSNGVARLTGNLADGTPITYANSLSKTGAWPFYFPLARGKGSISGPVQFRDQPGVSDLDLTDALWFKPANAKAACYPDGWPDGILTDILGSKFVAPTPANPIDIFSSEPALADSREADATFVDGNLPDPGMSRSISVSLRPIVSVLDRAEERLTMTMLFASIVPGNGNAKRAFTVNGRFGGSFIHPVSLKATKFFGVVFQKQQMGFGFFTGVDECGSVTLAPR